MSDISCEGNCEAYDGHAGEIKRVAVKRFESEWKFNYCENAIKEDERRGFEVVILPIIEEPK